MKKCIQFRGILPVFFQEIVLRTVRNFIKNKTRNSLSLFLFFFFSLFLFFSFSLSLFFLFSFYFYILSISLLFLFLLSFSLFFLNFLRNFAITVFKIFSIHKQLFPENYPFANVEKFVENLPPRIYFYITAIKKPRMSDRFHETILNVHIMAWQACLFSRALLLSRKFRNPMSYDKHQPPQRRSSSRFS